MLTLKSKERVEYFLTPKDAIGITLLRPNWGEGPEILLAVLESLEPLLRADTLPDAPEDASEIEKVRVSLLRARAKSEAVKAIPRDLVARIFHDYIESVDNAEGVTTGEQLLAIADLALIRFVLTHLTHLCRLTVDEGFTSASLSTSDAAPETVASPSPVSSIESEAGVPVSTATETQTAP